jgi:beta-lactamase superfamily II metal-dependent hydrolase
MVDNEMNMLMKQILVLFLVIFLFLLTGCARQLTESENEAPRLFYISNQVARSADGAFPDLSLDPYVEDETPDSLLQWTVLGTQNLRASLIGHILRVTFTPGFEGEESVEIKVTDAEGLDASQMVRFAVVNMDNRERRESDGSITITWTNSSPAMGKIYYSESPYYLEQEAVALGSAGTTLTVPLKALLSYRTYWYRFATVSPANEVLFESPTDSFQTFQVSSAPLFRMTTIDVRQGDSHLIETPEGRRILIDGGYGTHEPSFGDGPWDGDGVPLALNYLQGRGIFYLDDLVETHHHSDHYGGLYDIQSSTVTYGAYHSPSAPNGLVVGESWDIGDTSVLVTVLNVDYPAGMTHDNDNNRSIVLKFTIGQMDFLLTGDSETPTNAKMIESFGSTMQSEVLKINHHGSTDGTNAEWLNAVVPRYAIISCGAGNPYGHPHDQTLELLQDRGVRILRTDETGTIDILTDGRTTIEIWP